MKEIKLTQGKVALIDDEDFEYLNQFKWCTQKVPKTFYARRNKRINGKQTVIYMHREIMKTPNDIEVDHQDHNGLNCQKSNMRNCSIQENNRNARKTNLHRSSKYKGVHWRKSKQRWNPSITYNGKLKYLGLFSSEIEAAFAYNRAAKELFGDFAYLNPILIKRKLNGKNRTYPEKKKNSV